MSKDCRFAGLVERILDKEWGQNGDEPKTSTIDLAKKLVAVARSAGCLTPEQLTKLDDLRANLEQYRKEGMTQKNLKLIRQVLNSEVWAKVINCPDELMRRARSLKDQAPVKAAVPVRRAGMERSTMKQCAFCGGGLGLLSYRKGRLRFCKRAHKAAYVQREYEQREAERQRKSFFDFLNRRAV